MVHHDGDISADFVKILRKVPDTSSDPVVQDAVNMLDEFIDTGSKDNISDFVLFTTGSMIATGGLRPECFKAFVDQTEGFFASACSFELKIDSC